MPVEKAPDSSELEQGTDLSATAAHSDGGQPDASGANESITRGSRWLWLLAAVVVALYAAGINEHWRIQRDGALYLSIGRSLAEGQGYTYNYQPHTLALPGFPVIIAAVFRIFGESFLALNVLISLMGLACIALSWLLLRELRLPRGTLIASFLLIALSRLLYYYSGYILTEVPFTLFVLLALWSGERMLRAGKPGFWFWCAAAALMSICATAIRPFGPALTVALLGALWLSPRGARPWRRNLGASALIVISLGLAVGLWMYRTAQVRTPADPTYLVAFRGGRVLQLLAWALSVLPQLLTAVGEAIFGVGATWVGGLCVTALILWGLLRLIAQGERLLPIYAAVHMAGICLSSPGRRYLVPALPILCCSLVIGAEAAAAWAEKRRIFGPVAKRRTLTVLLVLLALGNVARIGKVVVQNRTPDFYGSLDKGRWSRYFQAADWLKHNAESNTGVIGYESRVLHFMTRLRTVQLPYDTTPEQATSMRDVILRKNVGYAIVDPDKAGSTRALEELFRQHPGAAETALKIGDLTIVRVHADKLGSPPGN